MRQVFENEKTGKREEFEFKNGEWVKVNPPQPPQTPMGYGQAIAQALAQGTSLGFSDELVGGLVGVASQASKYADTFKQEYELARDLERQKQQQAAEQYPAINLAGQFAGGILTPIPGAGWVKNAASAPAMVGRMGALGAGAGAVAGLGASESMDQAPVEALKGAGIGAVAGPVIGGLAAGAGKTGRSLYEAMRYTPEMRARQNIRSGAPGLTAAGVSQALSQMGPAGMLLDVDPAFARQARGAALTNVDAERIAIDALNQRQAQAPGRMKTAVEEAANLPVGDRLSAVEAGIAAERQRLGPEYEALQSMAIPITPELQAILDTPRMAAALRKAMNNWMTRNPGAPNPIKAGGVLPGDVIQEMKKVADDTINSATANPSDVAAAKSIREALLQYVDPLIPQFPAVRQQYATGVMQPEEGIELGSKLYTGTEDRLAETLSGVSRLSPEGRRGYLASGLEDALNTIRNRVGTGEQFYGGGILSGNELAMQRALQLTQGDPVRAAELLRKFGVERQFVENRTSVLPNKGSQTASRQQAAAEAEAMGLGSVAADAKTGGMLSAAGNMIRSIAGQSPAVARETMRILTKQGLTRSEVEQIMSGYVPPSAYEAIQKAIPYLTRLAQGTAAAGTSTPGALQPQ